MKKGISIFVCLLMVVSIGFMSCQRNTGSSGVSPMEMVINNGTNVQSLDPSQVTGVPEHRVYMALFEGLVSYDPQTAKAVPGVAESWAYSNNNETITFTLRQGITWSDGTAITAQQFVDSWLYFLDPANASEYGYMMGNVIKGAYEYNSGYGSSQNVGIRAVNDRTFEVNLVGPVAYALDMMAHYAFSVLPLHAIQRHGTAWTRVENFVGNGPFTLSEYIPNNRIVVVPNDRYWNKANVHLTKITFLPIEDQNTAYNAYLNGEIDWGTDVPLARIDEVKLHKDYQVSAQAGTYYLLVNQQSNSHAALRDARVRKAISMVINREELVNNITRGGQLPATSLVPAMGEYQPPVIEGFNIAEAQRLLADAGFPGGQGLPTFEYVYNTLDSHRIIGEYIQQSLRNHLGININLVNMEWATYLDYRSNGPFQLARAGWIADYLDPSNLLELLQTGSGNNDGQYSNPAYDALIRQAASLPDSPQRNNVMRQAEEIGVGQDQALIPIYYYVSQSMIDLTKWAGWYANVLDVHPYVGIRRR
ncbi:MAG: peptide ABC transporter substrate-binding protein [Treponema sp.]|nr:peptide ABC transporter substrate-binding protein [Treponema sp.]